MPETLQHLTTDTPGQCFHPDRILTYQRGRGIRGVYCYQCQTCGQEVQGPLSQGGLWVPRWKIPHEEAKLVRDFDESIRSRWFDARRQEHDAVEGDWRQKKQREREEELQMWREAHAAYLLTPEWRELRRLVLERENNTCQGCGQARAAEVHHASYRHWKCEFLFELVALCRSCHQRYHDQLPTEPEETK